jgi:hypothetical protein
MKPGLTPRSLALAFLGAVLLYTGAFCGIEFWRHRRGPWQIDFVNGAEGASILIAQPALHIATMKIVFAGEGGGASNSTRHVALDDPRAALPFGKIIYADLTSLPGVVTFDLFGHEIELLPSVLVINERKVPWHPGTTLQLHSTNKPSHPPRPPNGWTP